MLYLIENRKFKETPNFHFFIGLKCQGKNIYFMELPSELESLAFDLKRKRLMIIRNHKLQQVPFRKIEFTLDRRNTYLHYYEFTFPLKNKYDDPVSCQINIWMSLMDRRAERINGFTRKIVKLVDLFSPGYRKTVRYTPPGEFYLPIDGWNLSEFLKMNGFQKIPEIEQMTNIFGEVCQARVHELEVLSGMREPDQGDTVDHQVEDRLLCEAHPVYYLNVDTFKGTYLTRIALPDQKLTLRILMARVAEAFRYAHEHYGFSAGDMSYEYPDKSGMCVGSYAPIVYLSGNQIWVLNES